MEGEQRWRDRKEKDRKHKERCSAVRNAKEAEQSPILKQRLNSKVKLEKIRERANKML